MSFLYYKAINWNETEDIIDQFTWEKLTNNFWLDTRIPVNEDYEAWQALTPTKKEQLGHLLASVSLNSALQAEIGTPSLRRSIQTQQEEAVLNVTTFMASVHNKAITTIYRGVTDAQTAANYYEFADNHPLLQQKMDYLEKIFKTGTSCQKKLAFIFLEMALSFGMLTPLLLEADLVQTKKMLENMLRGSSFFTAYQGYKLQKEYQEMPTTAQQQLQGWFLTVVEELTTIELAFFEQEKLAALAVATSALTLGKNYCLALLDLPTKTASATATNLPTQFNKLLLTPEELLHQALGHAPAL